MKDWERIQKVLFFLKYNFVNIVIFIIEADQIRINMVIKQYF